MSAMLNIQTQGTPIGVNKNLPYNPSIDEILYVEKTHTIYKSREMES